MSYRSSFCKLPFQLASLLVVFFFLPTQFSAAGNDAAAGENLRFLADFAEGEPKATIGTGDLRMSRIWRGRDDNRLPYDSRGSRIALDESMETGRNGTMAFLPATDAAFRAEGNLNPSMGTFSTWIKPGRTWENGGPLFSGVSFLPVGPRGGIHWVLGVGGGRQPGIPEGHLFLYTNDLICISKEPLEASGDWVLVTAVWDADQGAKLFVNGREVGSTWGQGANPDEAADLFRQSWEWNYWTDANDRPGMSYLDQVRPAPIQRLHVHPNRDGLIDEIRIYDVPLSDGNVERLAAGQTPDLSDIVIMETDPSLRSRLLGWDADTGGDLIPWRSGVPLRIREPLVVNARDDLRQAGWAVVDGLPLTNVPWYYHGYRKVRPREIVVTYEESTPANYLRARGDFRGRIVDSESDALLAEWTDPREMTFRRHLDANVKEVRAVRDTGRLAGLYLYNIEEIDTPADAPDVIWPLDHGAKLPLQGVPGAAFHSIYPPGDRNLLTPNGAEETQAITIQPMTAWHLLGPVFENDQPVSMIELRLALSEVPDGSRLFLVVHDPFTAYRELGRFDFVVEGAEEEGELLLQLDLRDTLYFDGETVWLTLMLEEGGTLNAGGGDPSTSLGIRAADPDVASKNRLEWELPVWRSAFEGDSEPRAWNRGISDEPDSGWWLMGASPQYDHMSRVSEVLLERYPEDERVRSWYQFIRPNMPNPARDMELPEAGDHPLWAVLARENLRLYHAFVDYWTRNRAHPKGELGNFFGDDSVLLQDWVDLSLIYDPEGRYSDTVRRFADGMWETFTTRGEPMHREGIVTRWTDGLHAYENGGMNVQPLAFLLDYGDPVVAERLIRTAAHYDNFFLGEEVDGARLFNSDGEGQAHWGAAKLEDGRWTTEEFPPSEGSPINRDWFLTTHPGMILRWYFDPPEIDEMFNALGRGVLQAVEEGRADASNFPYGGSSFLLSQYFATGDPAYLEPILRMQDDEGAAAPMPQPGASFEPATIQFLPDDLLDREAWVAASRANAEDRFDDIGSRHLGFGDRRYERNWMEWWLSGNKDYLEEALAALYRHSKYILPARTVAEQSGDRVSPPKQLVSRLYLGGVVASRNHNLTPTHAVSYEGLSLDFAALVADDRNDQLRVVFYNFEDQPQEGLMRVWRLEPGRYKVRTGYDQTGDDRIDELVSEEEISLVRGDALPLELASQQLQVVELEQIAASEIPLRERPDLAVSSREIVWDMEGRVHATIHNLGNATARDIRVVLKTPTGEVVAEEQLEELDRPADLKPSKQVVTLEPPVEDAHRIPLSGKYSHLILEIDPDGELKEITRRNNRARVSLNPIKDHREPTALVPGN